MCSASSTRKATKDNGHGQHIIKLNVGGRRFMTTYATLRSKGTNFLTKLIDNDLQHKIPSAKDEQGYYFIDQNGTRKLERCATLKC